MALNFPSNPNDGDTYGAYTYNASLGTWDASTAVEVYTGVGTTAYDSASLLPLTGNDDGEQAFVSANNHLYIWNGSGWYNIALINTAPSITDSGAGVYELATDGTPTVISLTANDPEGIPLTWSYSVTSGALGGTTVSNDSSEFTITPTTNEDSSAEFTLTFTASDGINIATAVNQFSLNFITIVENSKYTSALITSISSTNGGTNSTVTDSSTNNHTVTVAGNASSQTFSPYRSGGYSYYFDGSDSLRIDQTADLAMGTSDFTLELWVYPNAVDGLRTIFDARNVYGSEAMSFQLNAGVLQLWSGDYSSVTPVIYSSSNVVVGEWQHVVFSRSGGTNYLFINGVLENSNTTTFDQSLDTSIDFTIGESIGFGRYWDGYISDFRIVKGTAVYTANFTPPTERLEAITNTSLLTCHLPYVKDGSTNNHSITITGNVSAKPFGPYDYSEYDAATHGGSVFFDGSNDYHDQQISAIGTSDFTLEFWAYHTVDELGEDGIFTLSTSYGTTNTSAGLLFARFDNIFCAMAGATASTDSLNTYTDGDLPIGSWYHIAICRSSGTTTLYYNGTAIRTASDSVNYTSTYLRIGTYYSTSTGLQGYVSDFRIVIGTAVYTADFTPPTKPLTAIAGTELLLSYGADVSIADKTQKHEINLEGNTQSSTTVTKYGSSSMYFDGSGDYITFPLDEPKSGEDFTIECWFNVSGSSRQDIGSSYTSTTGIGIGLSYDNAYDVICYNGNSVLFNSVGALWSENVWNHLAVCRSGTNLVMYVNGTVAGATVTNSTDFTSTNDFYLGAAGNGTFNLTGYIEDFRITKGLARYYKDTANFTPPTEPLTAITNTSLLTCHLSSIEDGSSNAHAITKNGGVSTQASSPYGNGYSVYFDGTDDYLSIADDASLEVGSGDFTLEAWVYKTSSTSTPAGIFCKRGSSWAAGDWSLIQDMVAGELTLYSYDYNSSGTVPLFQVTGGGINAWHHIALSREGNTWRLFVDGTVVGEVTSSITITDTATPVIIGKDNYTGGRWYTQGYISDLRLVKGTAVYTSNFTPPTEALLG